MKKFTFILLFLLTGCTTYPRKDGKIVFDSNGDVYRLRVYKPYSAKEVYYLNKLEIKMTVQPRTPNELFK